MRLRKCAAVVGAVAVCVAVVGAEDALTTLGIRVNQAQGAFFQVLKEGRVYGEMGQAAFKAASTEARVALVNGVLTWARQYTESPEFAKRYATTRTQGEPRVPGGRKWSAEEELNRRQAFFEQRIANEKKTLEAPPSPRQTPEQQQAARKRSEDLITRTEAALVPYKDPVARAELRKPFEIEDQRYKEDHARWEQDYPADYRLAVAKRLREFLALSATVDFGAKLVPCKDSWQHHSCFADPTYEKKPDEWKRLYRAGRQPVEAVRAFATNWLADLEKK